jgi:SAM-dependent methyltransferase
MWLDVGCGTNKQPGSVGVDQFDLPGVDKVCNLNERWPFADNEFEGVLFRHSINHLDDFGKTLAEAARVTRSGGRVKIFAPHFSSDNIFTDPTVKFFLGYRSVNYYCDNIDFTYRYYAKAEFDLVSRRIYFYKPEPKGFKQKCFSCVAWPFDFLANLFPRIYEKYFCFIFRANELVFELKVK